MDPMKQAVRQTKNVCMLLQSHLCYLLTVVVSVPPKIIQALINRNNLAFKSFDLRPRTSSTVPLIFLGGTDILFQARTWKDKAWWFRCWWLQSCYVLKGHKPCSLRKIEYAKRDGSFYFKAWERCPAENSLGNLWISMHTIQYKHL